MYFYVRSYGQQRPNLKRFPCVLLEHDNWDDYGYRTTCHATFFMTVDAPIELGDVKIMQMGQTGTTVFPGSEFERLPKGYASFGGKIDYYEQLFALGSAFFGPYLRGLRDVVFNDTLKATVEDTEAFRVSLMRFSGAERTLVDGRRIFAQTTAKPRRRNAGFVFRLKTALGPGARPLTARFDFTRRAGLPNRVNVLIGYNGTGKTRLLSNIATVVTGYGYSDKQAALDRSAGRLVGNPPPFGSVIVVSYSAFDTFALPGNQAEKDRLDREGDLFGYIYCGLRERVEYVSSPQPGDELYRVRTPVELQAEFLKALRTLQTNGRMGDYREVIETLLEDGSFQRSGLTPLTLEATDDRIADFFAGLSSGHKIVLKIVTELVANLDRSQPTLVLLDEPETHLHPPLLSSLLRGLRACLDQYDGFAIVATHSPVVLQETPSRYVNVLRRIGSVSSLSRPSTETFGETLGAITQEVFNLDEGLADWPDALEAMAKRRSLKEIETALKARLGFTARSYIASARPKRSD